MIVMGGIVGSGIFINPYVVALRVHTPVVILGVWLLGGGLALLGAFIWAELASRCREQEDNTFTCARLIIRRSRSSMDGSFFW
jgi:amino acid permease